MRKRMLTVAGLVLLATFGYVPRQAPLSDFVGATAAFAEPCTRQSLCGWVNLILYKFEFCIEKDDCK